MRLLKAICSAILAIFISGDHWPDHIVKKGKSNGTV